MHITLSFTPYIDHQMYCLKMLKIFLYMCHKNVLKNVYKRQLIIRSPAGQLLVLYNVMVGMTTHRN